MSNTKFTVGEVSRITGISKDTLRYYDKIGLFCPKMDPVNGYRYYTLDQFWCIDIITCFRKLRVPLDTIQQILSLQDNGKIVEILKAQKLEAEQQRDYYASVVDDIEWYCMQNDKIVHSEKQDIVFLEELPEKQVIYGMNTDGETDYHVRLQEHCKEEVIHAGSIKRNYGYFLSPRSLQANAFLIKGSYVEIGTGRYQYTPASNMCTIPAGTYACFVTYVRGKSADFTPLTRWLRENGRSSEFIVAEEIGLQLFYYNQFYYPCEIKALLQPLS